MTEIEIQALIARVAQFQVKAFIGWCKLHGYEWRDDDCQLCSVALDERRRYFTVTARQIESAELDVYSRLLATALAPYLHDGEDPEDCLRERLAELSAFRRAAHERLATGQ